MRDHGVLKDIYSESAGTAHKTARGTKITVRTVKAPGFGDIGETFAGRIQFFVGGHWTVFVPEDRAQFRLDGQDRRVGLPRRSRQRFGLEPLAKQVASAIEAGLDGLGSALQNGSGFGDRHFFPFAQHDGFAHVVGEVLNGGAHGFGALGGNGRLMWSRDAGWQRVAQGLLGGFGFGVE